MSQSVNSKMSSQSGVTKNNDKRHTSKTSSTSSTKKSKSSLSRKSGSTATNLSKEESLRKSRKRDSFDSGAGSFASDNHRKRSKSKGKSLQDLSEQWTSKGPGTKSCMFEGYSGFMRPYCAVCTGWHHCCGRLWNTCYASRCCFHMNHCSNQKGNASARNTSVSKDSRSRSENNCRCYYPHFCCCNCHRECQNDDSDSENERRHRKHKKKSRMPRYESDSTDSVSDSSSIRKSTKSSKSMKNGGRNTDSVNGSIRSRRSKKSKEEQAEADDDSLRGEESFSSVNSNDLFEQIINSAVKEEQ